MSWNMWKKISCLKRKCDFDVQNIEYSYLYGLYLGNLILICFNFPHLSNFMTDHIQIKKITMVL